MQQIKFTPAQSIILNNVMHNSKHAAFTFSDCCTITKTGDHVYPVHQTNVLVNALVYWLTQTKLLPSNKKIMIKILLKITGKNFTNKYL